MDVAMMVAVALVVVIPALTGYWRGAGRGLLAVAGTLLGVALVDFWAVPWGEGIASSFDTNPAPYIFAVSCVVLTLCALLVGYGSGGLLPATPAPSPAQRLLGALLGLLNGALIAGYVLEFGAESNPAFEQRLERAPVAAVLLTGLPTLLLGVAALLAMLVIGRWLVSLARRPAAPAQAPATAVQQQKDREVLNKINERIKS